MKRSGISLICVLIGVALSACTQDQNAPTGSSSPAAAMSPLPDSAYKASITPLNPPQTLRAGEAAVINVKVKNVGNGTWPAKGQGVKYKVDLGNHWLDTKGTE